MKQLSRTLPSVELSVVVKMFYFCTVSFGSRQLHGAVDHLKCAYCSGRTEV